MLHLAVWGFLYIWVIFYCSSLPEPFDPPQNVTVSNVTASSVTLTWSPPTEPNGIIVQYTIHYSENGTLAMQVRHKKPKKGCLILHVLSLHLTLDLNAPNVCCILKTIPVSTLPTTGSPGSAHSYTLGGLVGGANYTLWMTSSTWQGDGGVHSVPFTLALPEDGQWHTHMERHARTRAHTHTRTHTYACTHTRTRMYACTRKRMYVHTHGQIHTHTHTHTHTQISYLLWISSIYTHT